MKAMTLLRRRNCPYGWKKSVQSESEFCSGLESKALEVKKLFIHIVYIMYRSLGMTTQGITDNRAN